MSNCRINIFEPGKVLNNKWVILELIGKGAMGEIYLAHQLNLKRDVAIKVVSEVLLKDFEGDPEEIDTALQRFKREVHAMARVRHPNVLQIFDYGSGVIQRETGDCPVEFIVMEYIPGDTLRFTMSEEGFYPEQELTRDWLEEYFLPVLDGLQAIHDLDIVHRDIKPENILMDGKTPKIADFGLARSTRLKHVTQSMDVKGTAHYMSSEHFFDFRKADQRADIYSLGKILFEAVNGKLNERITPFKTAALPNPETPFFKKLDRIIQNATAENRENRLNSIAQLREAILEAIDVYQTLPATETLKGSKRSPVLHNPIWIWTGIGIAVAAIATMTIWHLMGEPGKSSMMLQNLAISNDEAKKEYGNESSPIEIMQSGSPKQSILTKDGASMHFVPAGVVILAENGSSQPERSVEVSPFFMDETRVTNHQYVEFLNRNLFIITVERGVVRGDDEIWLLLDEIFKGYEPIVFRDGEFKISNAVFASNPVLRVTAYGASAYAAYYDKRLPTYTEWLLALGNGGTQQKKSVPGTAGTKDEMEEMHGMMNRTDPSQERTDDSSPQTPVQNLLPDLNFKPNQYGIRGLNKGVAEWGIRFLGPNSKTEIREAEYVILGGIGGAMGQKGSNPSLIIRHPWEAFELAGFRCARSVRIESNKAG